jgi:hypothetical protein
MTALIILLARWRMRNRKRSPSPCEVALEHIIWLRRMNHALTAAQAGLLVGAAVYTWAAAVEAFAAAWEGLPEAIRREGNR